MMHALNTYIFNRDECVCGSCGNPYVARRRLGGRCGNMWKQSPTRQTSASSSCVEHAHPTQSTPTTTSQFDVRVQDAPSPEHHVVRELPGCHVCTASAIQQRWWYNHIGHADRFVGGDTDRYKYQEQDGADDPEHNRSHIALHILVVLAADECSHLLQKNVVLTG
jgi:hypothetical protein